MKSKQRGEITTLMLVIMAGMLVWSLSGRHSHMGPMGMMNHASEASSPSASAPEGHNHEKSASTTAP